MMVGQVDLPDLGNTDTSRTTSEYLTSREAAAYLRKSVSWLLRQADIPYLPGNPNVYSRRDLDEWFQRSKKGPKVASQ